MRTSLLLFLCLVLLLSSLSPASAAQTTNTAGIDLIKSFEGWFSCWYLDPVGLPTIGWGHLIVKGDPYKKGDCITKAEGTQLLQKELRRTEACISAQAKVKLSCNEFAALVSWAFNVGCGASGSSTLMKKLNAGDRQAVPSELARWNKAGGRVLAGLTRRRKAEGDMFRKGGGSGC
eukprot:TRINITY_DN9610_c0_g1_i1.p1 TRINITY_DN9610_c0_g1~~TRINITY_DN9610_c0_g1_i1.p1  ORF type:complete len:207 (-),score=44.86 TRINITY_DN9610_c0_g1_i1:129-656(-)